MFVNYLYAVYREKIQSKNIPKFKQNVCVHVRMKINKNNKILNIYDERFIREMYWEHDELHCFRPNFI